MLLIDSDSYAIRRFNTNSNNCLEHTDYKSREWLRAYGSDIGIALLG